MPIKTEIMGLMGYSLAKDRGQVKNGIEMCRKAIQIDSSNPDNYLYLGKLYLLAGEKDLAIKTFRSGLKIRRDGRVIDELKKLGVRKSPPFESLSRDHRLNIVAGKILRLFHIR